MKQNRNVRLIDIAKKAGVSVSAVSKSLLNKDDIGEETKSKILKIAAEMGYSPNNIARSLRSGKTSLLGVIIPDNTNPYYSLIIKGIEEEAKEHFFTTIITNMYENAKMESNAIKSLLSLPVDGLLSVPYQLESYRNVDIPIMFLSRFPYHDFQGNKRNKVECNYIISDDYEGQRLATSYLIEHGKYNIYALLDDNNTKYIKGVKTLIRLEGYRDALADAGIEYDGSKIFFGINTIEKAYATVKNICTSATKPFGMLLTNDYVSIGALRGIQDSGQCIPTDVDIVGYDDIELAPYLSTSLTTVHSAKYTIGKQAAFQIINLINQKNQSQQKFSIILKPYLVNNRIPSGG